LPAILFITIFFSDGIFYSSTIIVQEVLLSNLCDNETVSCDIGHYINIYGSLSVGCVFLSSIPAGLLINSIGSFRTLSLAVLVTAISYLITVFSENYILSIVIYGGLCGIGTGSIFYTCLIIISEIYSSNVGMMTSIVVTGSSIGSVIFPSLVSLILGYVEYRVILLVFTGVTLCCMILCCLLKTKTVPDVPPAPDQGVEMEVLSDSRSTVKINIQVEKPVWKYITVLTLSNTLLFGGFSITYAYLYKTVISNGTSPAMAGVVISLIGAISIPGRLLYGYASDLKIIPSIRLYQFSVIISAIAMILLPVLKFTFYTQVIFSLVFGFGSSGFLTLTTMYVIELLGVGYCNKAMAIINVGRSIGAVFGPILAILLQMYTNVNIVFYVTGGLYLTASIVSYITACIRNET